MSPWFSASAVAPHLQAAWGLGPSETGWLTTAVQAGFVAGTALLAASNLADLLPSRALFAACALLAACANGALAAAPGYRYALLCRLLTGASLAGVYPPAMKMVATWFRERRGLAIGILVGSLTLGKATPYLLGALEGADFRWVLWGTSAGAAAAALLVGVGYADGPFLFERRPFSWRLAGRVLHHRPSRLSIGGYLGHMWELYAMWTWAPAFLAASLAESGRGKGVPASLPDLLGFGAIAIGMAGCVWGGYMADRIGRERLVKLAMGASGTCALGIGFGFGASPWLLVPVAWTWGFFVVADSAQFSTLVTEVSPAHAVGTALTLQTSLGFLLTTVTIQLVPIIEQTAGWRWAFPILALGPAAGIAAIRRLERLRASPP
jgi:MFS family permease